MLMVSIKMMDLLGGCLCYSTKMYGGGDIVPLPSILRVFEYANSSHHPRFLIDSFRPSAVLHLVQELKISRHYQMRAKHMI